MRILSEREVKLVAGGYDTSGWEDGATVWGKRYRNYDTSWYDPSWYGAGDEFGNGGGGVAALTAISRSRRLPIWSA